MAAPQYAGSKIIDAIVKAELSRWPVAFAITGEIKWTEHPSAVKGQYDRIVEIVTKAGYGTHYSKSRIQQLAQVGKWVLDSGRQDEFTVFPFEHVLAAKNVAKSDVREALKTLGSTKNQRDVRAKLGTAKSTATTKAAEAARGKVKRATSEAKAVQDVEENLTASLEYVRRAARVFEKNAALLGLESREAIRAAVRTALEEFPVAIRGITDHRTMAKATGGRDREAPGAQVPSGTTKAKAAVAA